MSRYRPQRATGAADANHFIVRDFMRDVCGGFEDHKEGNFVGYMANYRGCQVWAVDTHTLGGLFLDWIVGCGVVSRWIEIKTPEAYAAKDHGIRRGEAWTLDNIRNGFVISDEKQIQPLFDLLTSESLVYQYQNELC